MLNETKVRVDMEAMQAQTENENQEESTALRDRARNGRWCDSLFLAGWAVKPRDLESRGAELVLERQELVVDDRPPFPP